MKDRDFPGARWWKFDFHTHTPASNDFAEEVNVNPESWLKAFMDKEIDCVAITDHNSGGWIDKLKSSLEKLKQKRPSWYRDLYLFPGVEISANGDVHILALFGCDKDESVVDAVLAAVHYLSHAKGTTNAVTTKSIIEVVDTITALGGIPIPAHVDGRKGLFKLPPQTLTQVLANPKVYAMELVDRDKKKHQLYQDMKVQWTEVQGSDVHSFRDKRFGAFTWIKMEKPTIDGLKLALLGGVVSVSSEMGDDPNRHAKFFVEELEISQAQYMGRSRPLVCRFSPFLNAIIGGRGNGKSTLLEFMRLTLRRDKEIPESLEKESRRYFSVGDNNLLTEDTKISLTYRKGEARYRLNWCAQADGRPSLEEQKDGTWRPCPGEIKSLFPVYIYSQKQIFEVAKESRALLAIIDKAPEVDAVTIEARHKALVSQYKQIESKQIELCEQIAQENRLRGESNDLARQIEQIEESGHDAVLRNYGKRGQQLSEFVSLEGKWEEMARRLLEIRDEIGPASFNEQHFSNHPEILLDLEAKNQKWLTIRDKISELAGEAQTVISNWHIEKHAADWMKVLNAEMAEYEFLSASLLRQGIDPSRYRGLLTQQKNVQKEIARIAEYQSRQQELEAEKRAILTKIEENRKALSEKRQGFLSSVLRDNSTVEIEIKPFGQGWGDIETEIRQILQCRERFDRDFEDLKDSYHRNRDKKIETLKAAIKDIHSDEKEAKDYRFANHLRSLPQESLADFVLWLPGDDLKVTFGPRKQRIEQGSPGQKTAALLAFILSYGDEPLLLDQPEDDLDNELISNLIVEQLRDTKSKRQVIVVTHNANIVVNGDAEMVLPLRVAGGETRVQHATSIQEKETRHAICQILEGGQRAFEQRYKRIHLED